MQRNRLVFLGGVCLLWLMSPWVWAEESAKEVPQDKSVSLMSERFFSSEQLGGIPAISMNTNEQGGQSYSVSLQIVALMTFLSFLPALIILMTSFTRIVVVMSILRQALGLQQTPSNQVILGIALFLTFFVMSPVLTDIHDNAVKPYLEEKITVTQALTKAEQPLRQFMLQQTRMKDLETFVQISGKPVTDPEVLIPAFITSELKTAFQIGFLLFLPFLVIDLVVASVLMAMGMMMLSPMIVSLPFKLMLFVLVDGWNLILGALAGSFGTL